MTTFVDLADRTIERYLEPGFRPAFDKAASTVSTSASTIILTYGSSLARGDTISISDSDYLVWAYDQTTKTATVEAGIHGSNTDQKANGSLVKIRPRWSTFQVAETIRDEIASWGEDLFDEEVLTLTASVGQPLLALTSPVATNYGLLDCRIHRAGVSSQLDTIYRYASWPRPKRPRIIQEAGSDYTYGALHLGEIPREAATVIATFAVPFDTTGTTFPGSEGQEELAMLGAAFRLTQGLDVARLDRSAQGEPRNANETQLTAASQISNRLYQMYIQRKSIERALMLNKWPVRIA